MAVNLDFQSSKRTAPDELFFSVSVFEEVGGVAVEAKRGRALRLLMGDPGKSVIRLRALGEICMSERKPQNCLTIWGVDPTVICSGWT